MIRRCVAVVGMFALIGAAPSATATLAPVPHNAQTVVITAYLRAMEAADYAKAFGLLTTDGRAYYRNAANFRSIFDADAYRLQTFSLVGTKGDDRNGRVYFARETAAFVDHAHDVDETIRVTAPLAVLPEQGGWRIKDPGHPWRAFAAHAVAKANGLRVTVKKVSFFARRIEVVATFANIGDVPLTVLPYGKSVLRDAGGALYRIIETKDWSLTDKVLFEGARLAPSQQYTGALTFESPALDERARTFTLTVAPALAEGADAPFSLDVPGIAATR